MIDLGILELVVYLVKENGWGNANIYGSTVVCYEKEINIDFEDDGPVNFIITFIDTSLEVETIIFVETVFSGWFTSHNDYILEIEKLIKRVDNIKGNK